MEAARASTALSIASERRCAEERATLAALRIKLNDTTHRQLCPTGHGGPFQRTRWHVLGKCQHPDLKEARRKAAMELQSKTHSTFTQKIKDPVAAYHTGESYFPLRRTTSGCGQTTRQA
jgi:hypothetical protein